MEQEYILRMVQRSGEKAVKCLKSRGRDCGFCCSGGQSTRGAGESPELCQQQGSQEQEFHTAVRPRKSRTLRGHEYSEELWHVMLEEMKSQVFSEGGIWESCDSRG